VTPSLDAGREGNKMDAQITLAKPPNGRTAAIDAFSREQPTQHEIRVREWMSAPVEVVSLSTPVGDAYSIMTRRGIRRLPVVDCAGVLVGIVTLGDLREARPSPASTLSIYEMNYLLSKLTVGAVMTHNPYTVSPETPIQHAAQVMLTRRVSGLPVVNDEGDLVGIITESDIFRMLIDQWSYFTTQRVDPGLVASLLAEELN
jgi:CBS domain-containing protein